MKQKNELADQLEDHLQEYLHYIQWERGYSPHTLLAYQKDLRDCIQWISGHPTPLEYLTHLSHQGYQSLSIARKIASLRNYGLFLKREYQIHCSLLLEMEGPKLGKSLPTVLSQKEMISLLDSPEKQMEEGGSQRSFFLALRDKALLEFLYATGARVSEAVALEFSHILEDLGYVRLQGKGSKERLVPLGKSALQWMDRYIRQSRQFLKHSHLHSRVFVSRSGLPLRREAIWEIIQKHSRSAGLEKKISPHTIRHSFATHLLEEGADIRFVQSLLGHVDVQTTQIYTHIEKHQLVAKMKKFHPRG